MQNQPITPPTNGVVEQPETGYQRGELLGLRAQVCSVVLPKIRGQYGKNS